MFYTYKENKKKIFGAHNDEHDASVLCLKYLVER